MIDPCGNCSRYHFRSMTVRSVPDFRCWNIAPRLENFHRPVDSVSTRCGQLLGVPIDARLVVRDVHQEPMPQRKRCGVNYDLLTEFNWTNCEKRTTWLPKSRFVEPEQSTVASWVCCTSLNIAGNPLWIQFYSPRCLCLHHLAIEYTVDLSICLECDYANRLRPN